MLRKKTIRPLYRQIHPSNNLETLKGEGPDSAAVSASFRFWDIFSVPGCLDGQSRPAERITIDQNSIFSCVCLC